MKSLTIKQLATATEGTYKISPASAAQIDAMDDTERLILGIESVFADLNGHGRRRLEAFERDVTKPAGRHCFRFRNDEAASRLRLHCEYRDTFWNNVHTVETDLSADRDITYTVQITKRMSRDEALAEIARQAELSAAYDARRAQEAQRYEEERAAKQQAKRAMRMKRKGWRESLTVTSDTITLLGKSYPYTLRNGGLVTTLSAHTRDLGFAGESKQMLFNVIVAAAAKLRADAGDIWAERHDAD